MKSSEDEFPPNGTDKALPSPLPDKDDDPQGKKKKRGSDKFSVWSFAFIFIYVLLIFAVVVYMDRSLPTPLTEGQPDVAGRFIEGRARKHLKKLTSVGSRPTGRG